MRVTRSNGLREHSVKIVMEPPIRVFYFNVATLKIVYDIGSRPV